MAEASSNLRIKDLPNQERPRERLVQFGAEALKNSELIAILLRTGTKGYSAISIGEQLLAHFKTLDHLARASLKDLGQIKGIGRDKAIALKSAFTLAQRMSLEVRNESPILDDAEQIANLLREDNRVYEVEHLQVILLNARRKLIRVEEVCQGTLDSILAHPREVFKRAIAGNAAAIVLVHNHPSGVIPHSVLCRIRTDFACWWPVSFGCVRHKTDELTRGGDPYWDGGCKTHPSIRAALSGRFFHTLILIWATSENRDTQSIRFTNSFAFSNYLGDGLNGPVVGLGTLTSQLSSGF